MTRLVALYPRDWRIRYEDEFLALLAERPPDPLGRLDIVRGALDARLHPQVDRSPDQAEPPLGESAWRIRTGWFTLLGGVLWILALAVARNGPIVVDAGGTYRDGGAGMPMWLSALCLLGAGMVAVTLGLPSQARAARAAAYVGSLSGLLWAFAPWLLWAGLIAFGGLLVVAVTAWRAGQWSGLALGLLVAGVASAWGAMALAATGLWRPPEPTLDVLVLILLPLEAAWAAVGASLVRAPRHRPVATPPTA